ncbi:MAG: hypothetical protein ACOZQL_13015 [Myxococcota bacterium]
MSEHKKGETDSTLLGLPEVDPQSTLETLHPVKPTDPNLTDATAPSLPPVARTKTGGLPRIAPPPSAQDTAILDQTVRDPAEPPRRKTAGAVPQVSAPRRASRVAVPAPEQDVTTDPRNAVPERPGFEWTMGRVAGLTAAVALLAVLAWVFWPSTPKPTRRPTVEVTPEDPAEPLAVTPRPPPKPVEPAPPPKKPGFTLDAKKHVIDPYAAHLDDVELVPSHRYRLRIERDDPRLGTALARLDEKNGWGVMRKMASHAALQFGGAKALRMHCEPGSHFHEGQTFPLELVDLATKKKVPLALDPSRHCWDFETARLLELGEGVKKRIRVPTDSQVKLGENVPLKVVYVLEALGDQKQWRTGVLDPGESLLAEGRLVRFALLDPYSGDNDGTLDLELLSGDTEGSGLVTPSATGAEFVPVGR